jgi:hypothetical protein
MKEDNLSRKGSIMSNARHTSQLSGHTAKSINKASRLGGSNNVEPVAATQTQKRESKISEKLKTR